MAMLTILSRVLGLVRDMVMVPLGGPVLADRFWTAFSIPNLFRRLFGEGALSAAFVPVFSEVGENEGWQRARVVLANAAGLLAMALAVLVVIIELGLWGTWILWGGDWARMIMLQLTALLLPFVLTICMLALGSAALNCKGHFAYPAFAPILLNVGLIFAAVFLAPAMTSDDASQFFIISIALLITGVVQVIGVVWLLARNGLAVMPKLKPIVPEVRRIVRLMAPMMIPLSILQFSAFADRIIALNFTAGSDSSALPLQPGVVRCLYASSRLYNLPLGVLAISIATAVFPLFSRYAARKNIAGLREATNRALRLCLFLGIPAGVALIIIARPVTTLIFQRGSFTEFDTDRASLVLQMYCIAMAAYFCNHILLRAFFSQKQTRAPMILACILAGVNMLLVIGGIFTPLRSGAFGLATATTATLNAAILTWLLHKRLNGIGGRSLLASFVKVTVAAGIMAAAMVATLKYFPPVSEWLAEASGIAFLENLSLIIACIFAGVFIFLVSTAIIRCRELSEFFGALRKTNPQAESEET